MLDGGCWPGFGELCGCGEAAGLSAELLTVGLRLNLNRLNALKFDLRFSVSVIDCGCWFGWLPTTFEFSSDSSNCGLLNALKTIFSICEGKEWVS